MAGNHVFSMIPRADIPRSTFNRSHGHKTTFDAGYLVPIFIDEALPGDTFQLRASLFARLATPAVPVMDNLTMDVFFFAVPNRLVWDNWQKFCGEQRDPGDSTDFLVPIVTAASHAVGSLFDYFGLPTGIAGVSPIALYSRAYNLIWNEWFRDENLQDSLVVDRDDGPDSAADYVLQRRGKRHDYFTSCLPWPQKGPAVSLPLGQNVPVISDGGMRMINSNNSVGFLFQGAAGPGDAAVNTYAAPGSGVLDLDYHDGLAVDLSSATAATINALREAFQIQRLLERDARGGTRYVEILKSHFGVTSPDARLQRPEFLGGGSIAVNINPVTQTSSTDATTPQGNLAAYGVAGGSAGFSKSFVEHSIIIGLVSVRADLSYQQGIPRYLTRRTRYDYFWPAFSNLGEQAVLNQEIYYQNAPGTGAAQDQGVFGYQERWAEYRYFPSKITGKFRSSYAQSLDVWHLAQDFGALPELGDTFIQDVPPVERVLAVQDEPQFLFDSHFSLKCTRPMPTYSVPGLIDHF